MEIHTQDTVKTTEGMVLAHLKMLGSYKQALGKIVESDQYMVPESALKVPFDEELLKTSKEIAEKYKKKAKVVILAGIGGSDMGVQALYEALRGYKNTPGDSRPTLITYNTIEPKLLDEVDEVLKTYKNPEDVVLIVSSKSGTTTETITNANILFNTFSKHFDEESASKQTVVVTTETSPLAESAREKNITVVSFPEQIGGRFSVFSPVGILPLSILGFNVDSFLEGARTAITASTTEGKPSSAGVISAFLFEAYLQGSRVHELFIWNPELEMLGKWYRQLLAESIGKTREDETKIGLTPTLAIGSTDLHSVGQLIFGGRNDRFTTFVGAPHEWSGGSKYKKDSPFTLSVLEGKKSGEVIKAIYDGVKNTYKRDELPYISIELTEINEREIGAFMALNMAVIMYLAQLFDVDAFDQPAVELYKNEVRSILSKKEK